MAPLESSASAPKERRPGHVPQGNQLPQDVPKGTRAAARAEFQILSTLSHPNIVKYYHREHLKQSQDLHFYMEYCGNGDLGRVIRDLAQKNHYAEESFVWSIFAQLVTALYRCHYGVDPPRSARPSSAWAPPQSPSRPPAA